jgi:hypothetical protein
VSRPPIRPDVNEDWVADALAERLVAGESMRQICADEDMPSQTSVYQRMARDEEFRSAIARAREAQQDAIIDSTVDLADAATPETVNLVRLQIWARQWRAGKVAPKKYGDKVTQEVSGPDGGPIPTQINVNFVKAGQ